MQSVRRRLRLQNPHSFRVRLDEVVFECLLDLLNKQLGADIILRRAKKKSDPVCQFSAIVSAGRG